MEKTRKVDKGDHWVLALDEANPTWKPAAPLPMPRNHLGGVALDGKMYAVGGQFGQEMNAVVQTAVHVYDPSTNAWEAAASLPLPRSQMHQSTLVYDGRIIILGGEDYPAHALTDVTMYDPLLDSWRALTPMPAQRKAGTAGIIGGQIYYAQGSKYGSRLFTTTFRGVPQFNECTITGTSDADALQGTEGDDFICGLGGNDTIRGLGGNDTLKGGVGADALYGGGGGDTLRGEGGNDRHLIGEAGNDTIDGGMGTDTASYKPSTAGVEASLTANTATSATDGSDTLANIENLEGTNYADTLTGSTTPNYLTSLGGSDKLSGGTGRTSSQVGPTTTSSRAAAATTRCKAAGGRTSSTGRTATTR